jgi:predicted dehydrogenase
MSAPVRWGILGTGWIAGQFVADLIGGGSTVTAVGSRSQASADAFAAEHGIPTAHASYEALAADPEVDVVYIATPHPMHAENALLVLGAGKHALIEKPFTLNQPEAREVVDLAAANGLVVLEAMWTRWLPHMVRLREIIAAGTIGDVRTVIADHNQKLPTDPAHRLNDPALGGGALLDLGIYPVSFAWDMLGEPSSVQAHAAFTATGVDRQTAILLGYPDGQQALLHCALDAAGPNAASVTGTLGRIELDRTFYAPTSFTVYDSESGVVERYEGAAPEEGGLRGMQFQAQEVERLIAAGLTAGEVLPPEQSVAIMGTLDEVRREIGLRYPTEAE